MRYFTQRKSSFQSVKSAACLNPVPVAGVMVTGLKFVTSLLCRQLISELRLKGSGRVRIPTSSASTEIQTKVSLSLIYVFLLVL